MLQNRPIALVLLAAALIFAGMEAVYSSIAFWNSGRLGVNFGFLLVPAGIGLLRLSEKWRKFTLYCLVLAVIGLLGFVVFEIVRPGQLQVTWFGTQTEGILRYAIFGALVSVGSLLVSWAFHTLTRPEIRGLFRSDEEPDAGAILPR